ncbi:MAG: folate family ECF transporter S component [Clostridia bacterium]|nr:folate family ECF transporter S component [Clostridia bacterium]
MSIGECFRTSARGLKKTRVLVTAALLLAVQVALGLVASIPIGSTIRISFGYLALAVTGYLFGPVPAMLNGALSDILLTLLKPSGAYFIGFTVTGLLQGMIYGLFLFKTDLTLPRVLIAKVLINFLLNGLLNTFWLQCMVWLGLMAEGTFWVSLPWRLLKNLAQYPIDILLLWPLLLYVRKRIEPKLRS